MGRNLIMYRYLLFLFTVPNVLRSCRCGLTVSIRQDSDYGDIAVKLIRQDQTRWLRHEPKTVDVIEHIYVKTTLIEQQLNVYEPFVDVLVKCDDCYFKIRNELWDAQKPFEGNKYIYYRVSNTVFEEISGATYVNTLRQSFVDRHRLELWNQGSVYFARFCRFESNPFGSVDSFPDVITCRRRAVWHYLNNEGVVFQRFMRIMYNRRHVFVLYFRDLNDNILSTTHTMTRQFPYYIDPWAGFQQHTPVPRSVSILDDIWTDRPFLDITISMYSDKKSTPMVMYHEHRVGDNATMTFISHPKAVFNLFIHSKYKIYFDGDRPFVLVHKYEGGEGNTYTLSSKGRTTVMRKIHYSENTTNVTIICRKAAKIITFVLYLNGQNDERMYRMTHYPLRDMRATVFAPKRHLAFGRIYGSDGELLADEEEFKTPFEQFIICGDVYYVVVRTEDEARFTRYFKKLNGQTWTEAVDRYPAILPV